MKQKNKTRNQKKETFLKNQKTKASNNNRSISSGLAERGKQKTMMTGLASKNRIKNFCYLASYQTHKTTKKPMNSHSKH